MTTTTGRLQTTFGQIFQWRSLRTRVTIFTLAIFVLGIWALSFYANYTLQRDMEKTLSDQQFSAVSILAADINDQLDERLKSLGKVAEFITPAMLSNAASMQKYLESHLVLPQMFNGGLWVARLDGMAIADVPVEAGRIGVNYSDRDWVGEVFKGKAIIGTPVMGKKLKAPVVPIGVPIRDPDGKVIGVLTGATDLSKPNFLSAISDHSYGKTGGYLLISPNIRTIVFATDKKRIMEALPAPGVNPFIDRTVQGWEGTGILVNPVGVEVLASAKSIPVAGWYFVALSPTKEIFAPIHLARQRVFLATIFLTLLAGGLTWWLLKRQLAPALATIKTLTSLADTDQPPAPLPITRQDEIGELIGGFNHLLETSRKREEALKASEEKFKDLYDSAPVGYHEYDAEGRITNVNQTLLDMLGYSPQEMIGQLIWQFNLEDDIARQQILEKLVGIRPPGHLLERNYRRKDGSTFPVLIEDRLRKDEQGRSTIRCTVQDITARKQAEVSLRETIDRLKLATNAADIGIWNWDFTTERLEWDERLCVWYAVPEDAIKAGLYYQFWRLRVHPDDLEQSEGRLNKARFNDTPYDDTFRIVLPDGSIRHIHSASVVERDPDGKPVRMVGINMDITARKRKEAQNLLEQLVEERTKRLREEIGAHERPQGILQEENDTILLVDDEPGVLSALTRTLRNSPYKLLTAGSAREALAIMETTAIKVIVSDEQMVEKGGSELLAEVQKRFPHTIRILLIGHITLEASLQAVNEGQVYRILTKPWDEDILRLALSAATERYNSDAEKHRLTEELRKTEKSLHTTLDGLSSHIALLDENGTIQFVNNPWRMFAKENGVTEDSVSEGTNYLKVCDEATGECSEGAAHFATGIRAVLSGEMDQFILEYPCDAPDKARWFVGSVSSFTDEKLRRSVVVSHGDITDRKQAEKVLLEQEALRLANAYNRTLIEVSVDPLMTIDPDGKITDVNTATENATGHTGQELIGSDFSSHFSQPAKAQQAHQQVFQDGIIQNIELELCHRNGSVIQALYNFAVYRNQDGEVVGVFAAARDITERKRDEEALRVALEAAEVASRAKSLFIGNMSHELRTPLSGVLGMTEALLSTPVTDKQRDFAETIKKSGKALLLVVSNILDFSKISAGNMALESSPFFVESVIAIVVNLFAPSAAEEKIGLHVTIDPELPAVRGDVHRLTQVVSNLVGNAVKFTKAGEIRVTAKILRRTEAEVELAISVQDTGIGMTEEELSRIFTGFTQGDTTRGRRFGGTGLGLTISRNLAELMGGTLQVESVFGKGSLFTVLVTFPIAQGFARPNLKSLPTNAPSSPINPVIPPKPERPPGDIAELQTLLEQLKEPLDNGEPRPCKDILAVLLAKSWPEEQEILLAELNRLVNRYRFQEALDFLNAEK